MPSTKEKKHRKGHKKHREAKKARKGRKHKTGGTRKTKGIKQTVKTIVNTHAGGGGGSGPPVIAAYPDPSRPQYAPQTIQPAPEVNMMQRGRAQPINGGLGPLPQVGEPFQGQGPSLLLGGAPIQQPIVQSANPNFNAPRRPGRRPPTRVVVDETPIVSRTARSHDTAPTLGEQTSGYAADLNVLPEDDQFNLAMGRIRTRLREGQDHVKRILGKYPDTEPYRGHEKPAGPSLSSEQEERMRTLRQTYRAPSNEGSPANANLDFSTPHWV